MAASKVLNSLGTRILLCFTSLVTGNRSEVFPSYSILAIKLSNGYNEFIGQPA